MYPTMSWSRWALTNFRSYLSRGPETSDKTVFSSLRFRFRIESSSERLSSFARQQSQQVASWLRGREDCTSLM